MKIKRIQGGYAVCKLDSGASIDRLSGLFSFTKTQGEFSLVCEENCVPVNAIRCERGWALYMLVGPFDFSLTGILASAIDPLAQARIPIFAVSTYDTDYVMLKRVDSDNAERVWKKAGFELVE